MYTLTVDDRKLVVEAMLSILKEIDPSGTHTGSTDPDEAIKISENEPLDIAFLDIEMPGSINGLSLGKN